MSAPSAGGVTVVGMAELSATALRARLLAEHDRFWDTDTRALHDPVWFHQFGGFGAVARSGAGEDVGYLLGVVTADRLAYLHLLAVRPAGRRRGVATSLIEHFAGLAAGVGARAVQAVAMPGEDGVLGLADRFGAHVALSRDHAGPAQDRVLLTCRLPLGPVRG